MIRRVTSFSASKESDIDVPSRVRCYKTSDRSGVGVTDEKTPVIKI